MTSSEPWSTLPRMQYGFLQALSFVLGLLALDGWPALASRELARAAVRSSTEASHG
jgi:hypothetical protein